MSKKPKIYDYFVLVYSPRHPRAVQAGYVPEQILVAERQLGRALTIDEDVRHINGDTQDNRPINLEIISTHASYRAQSVSTEGSSVVRKTSSKTFVPCKFQKPCWKEIRAPLARKHGVYLPYICSFSIEGDIYKCSHFWNFLEREKKENENRV